MTSLILKTGLALLLIMPNLSLADEVRLSIESDLVLHPEDVSTMLHRAVDAFNKMPVLAFDQIDIVKPVKTRITDVLTLSTMRWNLDTTDVTQQTMTFTAAWDDPAIGVGRLQINDKIVREEGGGQVIINLKGTCDDMVVRIPGGNWVVKGTVSWKWIGTRPIFEITAFDLAGKQVEIQTDMGRCEISQLLKAEMQRGINQVLANEQRMEELFRAGLEKFLNSHSIDLEAELMKPREARAKNNLIVRWQPHSLQTYDSSVVVKGSLELSRTLGQGSLVTVPRDNAMLTTYKVRGSGFVLPAAALPAIAQFTYNADLFSRRFSSKKVEALESLFESRFAQFFMWPDLMKFDTDDEFWFDFYSTAAPKFIASGMSRDGQVLLNVESPLALKCWAPLNKQYVPYVNFTARAEGAVELSVADSALRVGFEPRNLHLKYSFASEYLTLRPKARQHIAIDSFEKKVEQAISKKSMDFQIPRIPVRGGQELELINLRIVEQGVMLQLDSRSAPQTQR